MKGLTLKQYAEQRGITYFSAWRHLQKGYITAKKTKDGGLLITAQKKTEIRAGQPSKWTEEKVVQAVYKLCKGRYVKTSAFPPYLYKLCRKFCGSVRAAKWKAKIMLGHHWTYEKFIKCVNQFCRKRYREDKDWPPQMRALASQFCGSIRKAKWEAGVIRDRRKRVRKSYAHLEGLWTREKFLQWVNEFCSERYRKQASWPGYMRQLAKRYYGSVRSAKHAAGILKDPRKRSVPTKPRRKK